ncbi:putative ubiquitin-like-specific protease 1B [Tasmannia lanceolata]|uniref:putative ubiquitin-like-specific protease 1B n=1 Tax=Tasmannia lanceolata TaxID=3420 RepID=UPI0040629B30
MVGLERMDIKRKLEVWDEKKMLAVAIGDEDLTQLDMILFPLCQNMHWVFLGVDMVEKAFVEFNSETGMKFEELIDYINQYFKDRGMNIDEFPYEQRSDCAQQDNGFDCGLFVLQFIDHLYRGAPWKFGPADIPDMRQALCQRFLKGDFGECKVSKDDRDM